MIEQTINAKKRLLSERNDLLESIGQTFFEREQLPGSFGDLPGERTIMDIVLTQLEERHRALREERDRVFLDMRELQKKMTEQDKRHDEDKRPISQEHDELCLKIEGRKIKRRPRQGDAGVIEELEKQRFDVDRRIAAVEHAKERARRELRARIKPLEERIYTLDKALREIAEERESLTSNHKKRLRELGDCHYRRRDEDDDLEPRYQRLDQLRDQLAETSARYTEHLETPKPTTVKDQKKWFWLLLVFMLVAALGYVNRTRYRLDDLSLSDVSLAFSSSQTSKQTFVDLTRLADSGLDSLAPMPSSLPGGAVFRDMEPNDLQAFLVSRDSESDQIDLCGLRFRKTPTRFTFRLTQQGWRFRSNQRNWQAFTRNQWTWVVLRERTFLLLRNEFFDKLETLQTQTGLIDLSVSGELEPFDANHPLLFGYDHLHYKRSGDSIRLDLATSQSLGDRAERLRYIADHGLDGPVSVDFLENRLEIETSSVYFEPTSGSLPALRVELVKMLRAAEKRPSPPVGKSLETEGVPEPRAHIRLFSSGTKDLSEVTSIPTGFEPGDLGYDPRGKHLIVADNSRSSLHRYAHREGSLISGAVISVPGGEPRENNTIRIVSDRARAFAAVFREWENTIHLLSLDQFRFLYSEELPVGVRRPGAAAWDNEGERLYLTCTVERRRAGLSHGLAVMRKIDNRLIYDEVINIEPLRGDRLFSSIAIGDQMIYAQQTPGGRLLRYDLERKTPSWHDPSSWGRAVNSTGTERGGLTFSRNGLLLAHLDTWLDEAGRQALRLMTGDTTTVSIYPIEGNARAVVRVPMSDRFWLVSGNRIALVAKQGGKGLQATATKTIDGFQPGATAIDTWGHTLFLTSEP